MTISCGSSSACRIIADQQIHLVRYAAPFPSPRVERVSPGHLVAVAEAPDGSEVVIWRWYDAVVLGKEAEGVRLWEPAHGEVVAQQRRGQHQRRLGSRAYLSAGLPGAEWWVAGAAMTRAEDAEVELSELRTFLDENDLWSAVE